MKRLIIERFNYAPTGTFGRITLPSGDRLFTCERPWKANKTGVSCIPEGTYSLNMRTSPIVKRSSGGMYEKGWEVQDVKGRTFIMIHPANWPHELRGCISVGESYEVISGKQGVTSSRKAFDKLMKELSEADQVELVIHQYRPEYP